MPSVAVYVLQGWLLEKRSFVTVTGKASRPSGVAVGPLGKWLVGAAVLAVVALVALFYGFVLLGSFVKLWGADSTLTLSNYAKAFALSRRDIIDSVLLAAISAPISALVAIVIAWLLERRRFPGRRLMELFGAHVRRAGHRRRHRLRARVQQAARRADGDGDDHRGADGLPQHPGGLEGGVGRAEADRSQHRRGGGEPRRVADRRRSSASPCRC